VYGLLQTLFGLSVFVVTVMSIVIGFGARFGLLKERPQIQIPETGNFLANLLLLIAIPVAKVLSALYNNIVGVVLNSYPLVHLISLLTSLVGLAAMYVDKRMAQIRGRVLSDEAVPEEYREQIAQYLGWRLSERAIEWYALTGGGQGSSLEPSPSSTRLGTELFWLRLSWRRS
jgi:uncharacterized membrane protein YsdA (DUF1294 family)